MSKRVLSFQHIESALINPPPSVEELLGHLKDMDAYLSEELPPAVVCLCEIQRMFITKDALLKLTKHPDEKVQVAAVACLVLLIQRASQEYPSPQFDEFPVPFERMGDMFEPIVDALTCLGDIWSPLFAKRLSILESVAACKPCMVRMLDFSELVVKMFKSFLHSVRNDHPKAVVSGMRNIMVFVMEVSDNLVFKNEELVPLIIETNCAGFLPENSEKCQQIEIPAAIELAGSVFDSCASEEMKKLRSDYTKATLLTQRGLLKPNNCFGLMDMLRLMGQRGLPEPSPKKKKTGDGMGSSES